MSDGTTYDLVILGGGSGGYACALRGAELGLSVVLVEKDKVGGTCLHRGCIPTKALLHAGEIADGARESEQFGVQATLRGHRHGRRQRLQGRRRQPPLQGPPGPGEEPRHHRRRGRGPARLRRPRSAVGDAPTPARHVVLATGSYARTLPGLEIDGARVITSDQALNLDYVPRSAVVLGGGVIGVEFASVWKSFGADVTIVEALPHLVPLEDEANSKLLERAFRKRGIAFKLGARFSGVEHTATGVARHPRGRHADRGRPPARRRRPRAGLGRPRLRGGRRRHRPRLRPGRRVLPHQRRPASTPSATSSPPCSSPTSASPRASSSPSTSPG